MTDESIIKNVRNSVYKNKPMLFGQKFLESVLDLINRQKAEIEELRERISYLEKSIDCSRKEYNRLLQKLQQAKSEAIKEFAERLKSISIGLEIGDDKKIKVMAVSTIAIDKIAKEMTEVQK